MARLERFVALLLDEADRQNLIAASSRSAIWERHILDSAQLLSFAPAPTSQDWLDLGSGAGLPGIVVAIISDHAVTLVESRRRRATFLAEVAGQLSLHKVTVRHSPLERLPPQRYGAISARAFAPLDRLFDLAHRFSAPGTRWILPKGRTAEAELAAASGSWQGDFRIEPSMTDPDAGIIIATAVEPRTRR